MREHPPLDFPDSWYRDPAWLRMVIEELSRLEALEKKPKLVKR